MEYSEFLLEDGVDLVLCKCEINSIIFNTLLLQSINF